MIGTTGETSKAFEELIETDTDAGNVYRLYEEEDNELERVGFDTIFAGAFLLGKDARRITEENVRTRLRPRSQERNSPRWCFN